MEYKEEDFIEPNLKEELSNIKNYYRKVMEYINNYEAKSKKINEKMLLLSQKKYLDDSSSLELLKYQKNLIKNEKEYLDSLNNIYKSELNKQIFVLSEKTTIMYMSLQNINKEINKDLDIGKTLRRSFDRDEYIKIINDTIHNFSNIKKLLLSLKEYNINLSKDLENNNYHCKTLNHDIHKKRILIYINYKKLYETFITIIKYFSDHSLKLVSKLNNDTNYNFLVNNNSNDNIITETPIKSISNDLEDNTSEE